MISSNFVYLIALICSAAAADINIIPDGFSVGAATAAYQIEGAWNTSGKGESIWDRMAHTHPELFVDGANGDVADDSYHKYKEDIKALKDIGLQHYRFSISWPRILPTGDITIVNQDGIDYYNAVINELLENDITPLVTMYHWDLPQALQDLGGWANPIMVDYFEDYARLLYMEFGDRVKWWITINEPLSIVLGYGANPGTSPGVNASLIGMFLAAHTILKSHARAYHLYDEEFREQQQGKISITLNGFYAYPKTDTERDKEFSELEMQLTLGWFAHPVYSEEGDYPAVFKERAANLSVAQGRNRTILPEFGDYWVNYIKGTFDYFALNSYSAFVASASEAENGTGLSFDPSWPASDTGAHYTPEGFRKLINWVSDEYNRPDIFITENGWSDSGGLNDSMRIQFICGYMAEMLKAIYLDNNSVIGYTIWSLIDNLEWNSGFSVKFGLYEVDFSDPDRPRIPKDSAFAVSNITSTRQIPEEYFNDV